MSGKTKMHAMPSKKDLLYTCQYKVTNTDGTERVCESELSYGAFRTHVIVLHLDNDASKWHSEQYITKAKSDPASLAPRAAARAETAVDASSAPAVTQLQEILDELKRLNERVDATWQLTRAIAVKVSVESTAAAAAVLSTTTTGTMTEASPQPQSAPAPTSTVREPEATTSAEISEEPSAATTTESTAAAATEATAAPVPDEGTEEPEPPKKKPRGRERGRGRGRGGKH